MFSTALPGEPKTQAHVAGANLNVHAYVDPYRYLVGGTESHAGLMRTTK